MVSNSCEDAHPGGEALCVILVSSASPRPVWGPMPYEIFVSYSRKAPGICRDVARILKERLGFGETVFVDTAELAGGVSWNDELRNTLREVQCLVLLATQEAVDDPGFIRREIAWAEGTDATIIPIEFDSGASEKLLGHSRYQYIKAERRRDSCAAPGDLERRLRYALLHRTEGCLKNEHVRVKAWVGRNHPDPSFWAERWQGIVPSSTRFAIVAPAGSGKSVIAAHYVEHKREDPAVYAVLLMPETAGLQPLATALHAGTPQILQQRLQELEQRRGRRVLFIVDGLDQLELADDPTRSGLVSLLSFLASAGELVITCREDVWDSTFAGRLPVDVVTVDELDDQQVASFLPSARNNDLMRSPLFLNLALQHTASWRSIPKSDIEFFRRLFEEIEDDDSAVPDSTGERKRLVLSVLADAQLEQLAYAVPAAKVQQRAGMGDREFRVTLDGLKRAQLLVERWSHPPVMRLAHDLLDCYNIAAALYRRDDPLAATQWLCDRSEHECGWSTLASLVRIAHSEENDQLLRRMFERFLWILDRKHLSALYMAQAWAVTYVLREQLTTLLPLVLEALSGTEAPSLISPDQAGGSRLGTLLTQEAASSVASAFLGVKSGNREDAARVVPVLEAALYDRWRQKGRFIDALARYDTDQVREILVSFGTSQLDGREDLPSLRYVAQGLGRLERHDAIRDLLMRVARDNGVDLITRRSAHQALSRRYNQPNPPRTEEEIVLGLRIVDDRGNPSDWNLVREYAHYVQREATSGRRSFGADVCRALVGCLAHAHVYVCIPAADALGCFDDAMARDALLDQLLKEVLPAEARRASLEALRQQLERTGDGMQQQAFRMLLLRTARIAESKGAATVAEDLTGLAIKDARWIVTRGALEASGPLDVPIRTTVQDGPPIDSLIETHLEKLRRPTGRDLETKFRFTALTRGTDSLVISLAPTTWTSARKFQTAVLQDPSWASRLPDGTWITPLPFGDRLLPGLAVVHAIILTSDRQIIAAKRSAEMSYAPLHWSASFEEQLNQNDIGRDEDPFTMAALRGFREEFGPEIPPRNVVPLTTVMQIDLLNLGIVMLLRPQLTADEIHESWRSAAKDRWEAEEIRGLPLENLETALAQIGLLHVTSELRCLALQRWLSSH